MDKSVFDAIHATMPKLNPVLANGFAVSQLQLIEEYLDLVWRQVEKDFPPGLKYAGFRRCTPKEVYDYITKASKGKTRTFDISKSSVYMVRYIFTLNGHEIPDIGYVYLPYVRRGGICTLKGSDYVISPVLADVGLSVCSDSAFVKWHRAKITFRKMSGYVTIDGVRTVTDIAHSQIYNAAVKRSPVTNTTTLPHYLFAKFGVIEAFKRIGVDVTVVSRKAFSTNDYSMDLYTSFTTPTFKHNSRSRNKDLGFSDITLVVPKNQVNATVKSMMACFFYVVDQDPVWITHEHFDQPIIWKVMLGKMVLPETGNRKKTVEHMDNHIASVDGYLDAMALEALHAIGIKGITNIYDFFYYLIDKLPEKIATVGDTISSMYGKRLTVLSYVTEDITIGISSILFDLRREINKPTKKTLTDREIATIFKRCLPYGRILSLNSGKAFIKSVSSSSDCLLHKVTSVITPQTECGNGSGAKKRPTFTEEQYAHISNIELGGITNLPDRDPTGKSSLNQMACTTPDGTLIRNPLLIEELDIVQQDIERR